jgi:hypothetical protein
VILINFALKIKSSWLPCIATYYHTKEAAMMNKCASVIGHFDGHGSAPEQHRRNCPMRHFQGYPGSHWTPPSGNYLLSIAPEAARAIANKTTTKKWTNSAGHFDGCGGVLVQYRAHHSMEEVQGFGRSHWMPPLGEYCGR